MKYLLNIESFGSTCLLLRNAVVLLNNVRTAKNTALREKWIFLFVGLF